MNVRFTASQILSSNIVEFPLLSVIKLKHSISLRFWLGCWAICPQLLSLLASEWVRAVGHMLETWRKEEFRMNPWSFPASDSVTVPKVSLCPKLVSLVSKCLSLLLERITVIPDAIASSGPWASATPFLPFDSPSFRWK